MPKMKVLIEIDQAIWDAIPTVARYLQLPSDAQTPNVVGMILEHAILEAQFEAGVPIASNHTTESAPARALQELLDPSIAVPLKELAEWADTNAEAKKSLQDEFEDLARQFPTDQWILKVLTMPEAEQSLWKMSLAAVYSVILGPERRLSETWTLIERTNRMIQPKSVDNGSNSGDNTNSPTKGENNPST